jgi:hypothetical protein
MINKKIIAVLFTVFAFFTNTFAQTQAKLDSKKTTENSSKTQFFPLKSLKAGMRGTARTVFKGSEPEEGGAGGGNSERAVRGTWIGPQRKEGSRRASGRRRGARGRHVGLPRVMFAGWRLTRDALRIVRHALCRHNRGITARQAAPMGPG